MKIYTRGFSVLQLNFFLFKLLFSEEKKQKGKIHIKFTIYIRIPMSKYNTFSLWVYRFEWHFNILFNVDLNFMSVQNLCRLQVFELFGESNWK